MVEADRGVRRGGPGARPGKRLSQAQAEPEEVAPPEPKDSVGSTATQNGTTPAASAAGVELSRSRQSLVAAASGADVLTRRRLLGAVVAFAGVGLVVAAGHGLGAQRIA